MNSDLINIIYSIWIIFQEYGQTINSIVLFLTLIVIIWYSWETHRLRITTERSLHSLQQQLEPNVIAYFDNGSNFYSIVLVLSNEGGSTAKNVKIKFEPELDLGDAQFIQYFNNNAISKNGVDIQSRSKYVLRVGHTPTASPLYKENKIPISYKATVTFINPELNNKLVKVDFDLTIDQFFYRIDPEGKTIVEQELENINKNLSNISDALSIKDNKNSLDS